MKIAHLADVHLGFRQFHRLTPLGINQREADVANAFRLAVDGIITARPDAVLLAGDLFHAVRPTNAAIIFAFRQFQRLREALPEAPIVVIAGNHDTPRSSETGSILKLYEEVGVDVALDQPRRMAWPDLGLSVLAVPHHALRGAERPALHPEGAERHQLLLLHGEIEGVYPPEISGAAWGGLVLPLASLHPGEWSWVGLGHYHVQHEVEPRVWYSGSLEYVTSNPWGELRDERRHGHTGKGWLLLDLAAGTATRMPVRGARRVIDLPPLYGDGQTAEDLDRLIRERLATIEGGPADQIVRQLVFNVPREIARSIDHAAVRSVKAEALHFQLDLRRPDSSGGLGLDPGGRRKPLAELLRDYLSGRPLPAELDRAAFVRGGVELLEAVVREEDS
ncbi:MAG TPA: metallophosphoesterase [Gemmatimonadales bacterium]